MAFDIEKLLKGFLGDSESTKKTNNKNAKKRITKAQKAALADDGGYAKLQQAKKAARIKKMKTSKGQGYSTTGRGEGLTTVRTGAKTKSKRLTNREDIFTPSPDNLKDRKAALAKKMSKLPKKRPASISALSVIKKDTNIKSDKAPTKKVIVTKEQLKKSGLSLRDYMNMLQGKTRRDDKKSPPKKSSSKVMVDSFKKSNVSANKSKKAGVDEAKGDNKKVKNYKKNTNKKLDSKGNYKGTNIKPTKLQLERMKKRRARGAVT